MIKVVIISDSHGNLDNVRKIMEKEQNVHQVIHLGDLIGQEMQLKEICGCEISFVKGNCDYYADNPVSDVLEIGANRIFITHGHHYGVNFGIDRLCYAAKENQCNIVMYGHTHVPENSVYGGIIVVNPGSVSQPRQLNHKATYAVMKIDGQGKTDIRIQYV